MTREEAIKYIKSRCIGSNEERDGTQWSEAMWMAIEALADRPTVDKEYLIDLIQESVYDGEACAKLIDLVDRPTGWISVSEELPKPSHRVGNGIDEDWRISSLIAMKIHGEEGIADSYEIGVAEFSLSGEFDQWYFGNDGWYDKDKVIAWKYVEPYEGW